MTATDPADLEPSAAGRTAAVVGVLVVVGNGAKRIGSATTRAARGGAAVVGETKLGIGTVLLAAGKVVVVAGAAVVVDVVGGTVVVGATTAALPEMNRVGVLPARVDTSSKSQRRITAAALPAAVAAFRIAGDVTACRPGRGWGECCIGA